MTSWSPAASPTSQQTKKAEILLSLLREFREKRGLPADRRGSRAQLPAEPKISKYELGTRRLDLLELRDVCKVLGVSVVDFVRAFDDAVSMLEAAESKPKAHPRSRGRLRS